MKKKFAVPVINGKLCAHFGHCEQFAIVETDDKKVTGHSFLNPPLHQPGAYPRFLAQQGVNVIIAGGMGPKAQQLFTQNKIEVCMGVGEQTPEELVEQYLNDQLQTGENLCDH